MNVQASHTSRSTRTPWQIQLAVLFALLQRDLKARFGGRWMGAFWIFLEPIAHVTLMMLLFVYLRERLVPGVPFVLFLITGLFPFFIFRGMSLRVMGAIDGSRGLFGYRQVKPIDALLVRGALDALLNSAVYVVFLAAMGWHGLQWFPDEPLQLIFASGVLIVLGFSLGLLFAVLTDDLPQLRVFIRIAYLPLYIISGVIFPINALPPAALPWLLWNPILHLIEVQRGYFFKHYPVIDQVSLSYPAGLAVLLLASALSLYRVRRHRLLAS
ncbi:MAG: ABC transporter permease [Methylibium sp.]|uniref:ABC transporter permease n=1 Tax=Methylibium sp. TaxID=2067992 RepID=UPI0017E81CB3|nr:ABC transporter permease [Methylibium sp.]MBA3596113.1 ABC transporter permease [Methylibium sp.]